jgi:two-component sensor histidine kinase
MGTWDLDLVRHTAHRSIRHDQIFGYGELLPEWTYEIFLSHVVPEDREEVDRKFQYAIENKEDWNFECRILRKGGILRWILARGKGEYNERGSPVRMIGIVQDITERRNAEEELRRRNEDLIAANEEITATQEELQQNIDELNKREHQLNDALAEKEVLLAEIHHRVKNNLTAFISLLSLEGTYESSPEAQSLKKDLQNRARSMALIHETLYRTRKYSSVDMGLYLNTLIRQVADSYTSGKQISTIVEAEGVIIDLARATPCGLIVNELVTNSYKYAFPDYFDCLKERKEPCIIRISLTKEDGIYVLKAGDNGVGLPEGIDIKTTKSLGLKLVHFLARHQLRAKTEIIRKNGSEFIFRFPETITSS